MFYVRELIMITTLVKNRNNMCIYIKDKSGKARTGKVGLENT